MSSNNTGTAYNSDSIQPSELDVVIRTLAYVSLMREGGGENNINRIQGYMKTLAAALKDHPRFASYLTGDTTIDYLAKSASLHAIGNVGIPDRILLKPGRLTADEFEVIKTHPKTGLDLIQQAEQALGQRIPIFNFAKEIIYYHHERWDGSGYPQAIFEEDIPISARLFMVADVYNALVSRRIYKPQLSHQQAIDVIADEKGTKFDPDIVDAFLRVNKEFNQIAYTYADNNKDFEKTIDYLEKAIAVEP
jgi:putative two-component system response regulator